MASHLLKSGFSVVGYDPYQPSLDRVVAEGAQQATTPRDAAKEAAYFICMVANHHQAEPLLFDPEAGALTAMPKDTIILMCSTVAPAYIVELREHLDKVGRSDVGLIDSPVSGGAARAANGTLSIFASGDDAHMKKVEPILSCMSGDGKLYNVGTLGGGSKAKLIHQIFAGINIAMASEAMGLAAKAGLNTQRAFEELNLGIGRSWMFGNRVPHMLDPSLPPYSAMTIIAKDVGIITKTSRDYSFPLPLLSTSEQLYQQAISNGYSKEDDCVLVRLYLPLQHDLVHEQAKETESGGKAIISIDDVKNLMVAVHLAATSEAMAFCERLGVDLDLMYDIVLNAAGASASFEKYFDNMKKARWSLKGVPGVEAIWKALVSNMDSVCLGLFADNCCRLIQWRRFSIYAILCS